MPNYIDRDLGGIANSGVYPNSRPQINVADAINAVAGAFNQNKQGILQKAVLQAQNARAQQESDLAKASAATNGILPTTQAHDYVGKNNDAFDKANAPPPPPAAPQNPALPGVGGMPSPGRIMQIGAQPAQQPTSPQLQPTSLAPGAPPMQIQSGPLAAAPAPQAQTQSDRLASFIPGAPHTFGSRRLSMPIDLGNGYSIIPEMTAAGRSYDLMQARMEGMLQGRMISGDYGNERANIAGGYHMAGIGEQQQGADTRNDRNNTTRIQIADDRPGSTKEDPSEKRSEDYITKRVMQLTAPTKDDLGLKHPGLDYDAALTQATVEADKRWGKKSGGGTPASSADIHPTAADSATANTVFARIAQKGATVQDALNSPSLSPGVKALVRKHFGSDGH